MPIVKRRYAIMQQSVPKILLEVCGGCKPEEKILFVTDPAQFPLAQKMYDTSPEYPHRKIVTIRKTITMHGQDPEPEVAAAMLAADVIYGITKWSLFHSQARKDAVAKGGRFVNMVDYNMGMLEPGSSLDTDFEAAGEVCSRLAQALTGKKTCRITTARGTDYTCSIEGIPPTPQYGRSLKPGSISSPPDIECATCANEGTANGVVYVDGSIPHPLLGLIRDEVKFTIKDGLIVDISGGEQARILKDLLAGFNDPTVYVAGEIGIGLNPKCTLTGSMLEDEGALGTVHIASGSNMTFGGKTASAYHFDYMFRDPTMVVDGATLLQDGNVVI